MAPKKSEKKVGALFASVFAGSPNKCVNGGRVWNHFAHQNGSIEPSHAFRWILRLTVLSFILV